VAKIFKGCMIFIEWLRSSYGGYDLHRVAIDDF